MKRTRKRSSKCTRANYQQIIWSQRTTKDVTHGGLIVSSSSISAEHVHTTLKGINLLLNGGGSSGGSGRGGTSSSGGGGREGTRVSEEGLELVSLREGELVEVEGDGNAGLESLGDGVRHGGLSGDTNRKRDGGNSGQSEAELADDDSGGDAQDIGGEGGAVIIDKVNAQTVGKGLHAELVEKGGLGRTNLVASLDEVDGVGDLDLTLGNLGGDLKDLEKVSLSRIATSGSSLNVDIIGGNSTNTCRGRDTVGKNHVSDFSEGSVGEHKSNISVNKGDKAGDGVLRVGLNVISHDLADKGVLSHEHLGGSSHHNTSGVELLRADIINTNQEDLGVGVQEAVKLLEIGVLLLDRKSVV